ncbi:erv1 alr family protein [Cystoisospora suis]|uniref:Erv1 alr family protein n=1 Tax=Cystoisospora suis TaxID=483139 RepID=A0A2C6KZK9_9APIC|nr:erv1 alr family protein [Cystoisospora suis]
MGNALGAHPFRRRDAAAADVSQTSSWPAPAPTPAVSAATVAGLRAAYLHTETRPGTNRFTSEAASGPQAPPSLQQSSPAPTHTVETACSPDTPEVRAFPHPLSGSAVQPEISSQGLPRAPHLIKPAEGTRSERDYPAVHFCSETNDPTDPCNAQWLLLWTYAAYASPRPSVEEQRHLRVFFEEFPDQCTFGPGASCYSEAVRATPPRYVLSSQGGEPARLAALAVSGREPVPLESRNAHEAVQVGCPRVEGLYVAIGSLPSPTFGTASLSDGGATMTVICSLPRNRGVVTDQSALT